MAVADASHDPVDERALVDRARTDADAFAELYRLYVDRVHTFAYRRAGSREVAEDVTAATFEKALRGLPRFRWGPGGVGPWIFRIAANELADHHRRRGRRGGDRARRAADRLHQPATTDDVESIEQAHEAQLVRAALDDLNPRYQRALTLRYLAELDHRESARAMGISPSLMAVLVHRATAALRKAVEARQEEEPS
jgi:RNA polymerase sigma-70 factor (ECF subfamily)